MSKLKIGQVFRYPKIKERNLKEINGYPNFSFYTDLQIKSSFVESGINPIGK